MAQKITATDWKKASVPAVSHCAQPVALCRLKLVYTNNQRRRAGGYSCVSLAECK